LAESAATDELALSLIVPTFNEMHRLPARLEAVLELAQSDREVIFVDDASTDGTGDYLDQGVMSYQDVRVIRLDRNRGKGAAVRAGVARARGRKIVFMDADLATDLADLEPLLEALDRADVAIGSRSMSDAVVNRTTKLRSLLGGGFNLLVRNLSGLPLRDTQCGFKGFQAPTAHLAFHLSVINRFAFDVEVLVLASELGRSVVEVPVHWTEVGGSRVRPVRDALRMAIDVTRARYIRQRAGRPLATLTLTCEDDEADEAVAIIKTNMRQADTVIAENAQVHILMPHCTEAHALKIQKRFSTELGRRTRLSWLTAREVVALSRRHLKVPSLRGLVPKDAGTVSYRGDVEQHRGRGGERLATPSVLGD
jgi:dolichyl-phosphate beta-glucosyltransferase